MQSFIILAMGVIITVFSAFEYQKYSNSTTGDINKYLISAYTTNFFIYNDMSINYLMANYNNIYDGTSPTNTLVYNGDSFDYDSRLKNIYSNYFTYQPFFSYETVYFIYTPASSTQDMNPIPVLYMITSWDDSTNQKAFSSMQTPKQVSFAMLGNIVQKLNNKQYSGDTPSWSIPIIGNNKQCNSGTELYNNIDMSYKLYYKNQFLNMCQDLKAKGYNVKTYFYLTPIFPQK